MSTNTNIDKNITFKLYLNKGIQVRDMNIYSAAIRLGDLFKVWDIQWFRNNEDNYGYQREAKESRKKAISKRIRHNQFEPEKKVNVDSFVDNLNLNIRSINAEKSLTEILNKENDPTGVYEYQYIAEHGKIWIVDGQTRLLGARDAWASSQDSGDTATMNAIADTKVMANISFTNHTELESYIVLLINSYAKSLPAEASIKIISDGVRSGDVKFLSELNIQKKEDLLDSFSVAEKLNEDSDVLAGKLKTYNDSAIFRAKNITAKSLADSLKPLYKYIAKELSSVENPQKNAKEILFERVEAFLVGMREAYPPLFTDDKYGIYRTSQMQILMGFLHMMNLQASSGMFKSLGELNEPKLYKALCRNAFE